MGFISRCGKESDIFPLSNRHQFCLLCQTIFINSCPPFPVVSGHSRILCLILLNLTLFSLFQQTSSLLPSIFLSLLRYGSCTSSSRPGAGPCTATSPQCHPLQRSQPHLPVSISPPRLPTCSHHTQSHLRSYCRKSKSSMAQPSPVHHGH